jgi:hypothetical protein
MSDLLIEELRPMLGQLNRKLSKIGKSLRVHVDTDTERVVEVSVASSCWRITCDKCRFEFDPGHGDLTLDVACPQCGTIDYAAPILPAEQGEQVAAL